jgi:hypothetical protein
MSFIEDIGLGGNLGSGAVVGIVGVLLAPIVLPIVGGIARPLIKGVIKGGMIAYGTVRETAAEAVEAIEDIAAEANSEIAASNDAGKEGAAASKSRARKS